MSRRPSVARHDKTYIMSTLWNKGTAATEVVDAFTVGNDRILDMRLAKYDVIGSMAHIKMLESIGLLTSEELATLTAALEQILKEIEAGEFILEDDVEDIEKLRSHVFEKISPRMGKVNLNVTQIKAGSAHNVVPDRCDFVIDIRPTEQYSNEDILAELQAICESELKPRNLSNRSSATFEDSPLQKAAAGLGIETFSSPTTSDWMRISCDAIKMGPGDSARSHKKDEYVTVDEISEGIRTYIEFIERL